MFEPFIAGRADEKQIAPHWNDVLRLAISVRTGAASASLLLKRHGAYPRQNGLARALREIGRIERTLFMLDWLELTAASVPTAFGRFARQQQTFTRSSLPDRVPDLVQITVLSCTSYGVTPLPGG